MSVRPVSDSDQDSNFEKQLRCTGEKGKPRILTAEKIADIEKYGKTVLGSREFEAAMKQKHHYKSTVGQHSLDVAFIALAIGLFLEKLHVRISIRAIVIGCLCHDLGILDRSHFASGSDMCRMHPIESAAISREFSNNDATVFDMCEHHMFPLMSKPPKTTEGWIVSIADKVSSVGEVVLPPVRKKWERRNAEVMSA